MEAVLRRSPARAATHPVLKLPRGKIDWATREIESAGGTRQSLSERELALLDYLARHPGRPIDRDELLRGVWQIDAQGVTTRTVDMHIARLREKLQRAASDAEVIKTVRGRGYMLDSNYVANEDEC